MSTPDDRVLQFPGRPGGVSPEVVAALEALLFVSGSPIRVERLAEVIEIPRSEVRLALAVLQDHYGPERGIRLTRVASGWQLRTAPIHATMVLKMKGARPRRLGRAQLEVLSIVAWRQPATRSEIDAVRGVDSGPVVRKMLDRGLLKVAGRRKEPGRPLEYRTTSAFLELFGLPDLNALPRVDERGEAPASEE